MTADMDVIDVQMLSHAKFAQKDFSQMEMGVTLVQWVAMNVEREENVQIKKMKAVQLKLIIQPLLVHVVMVGIKDIWELAINAATVVTTVMKKPYAIDATLDTT